MATPTLTDYATPAAVDDALDKAMTALQSGDPVSSLDNDVGYVAAISPMQLGAVGDGVTDDATAVQAFLDEIAATDYGTADFSGTFAIGTGLTFGATGAAPATKRITGTARLTALAPMDEMLLVTDASTVQWDALDLTGTGSTSFASRTCKVGVRFDNCGRQAFRKIVATGFAFAGIAADQGNNSLSHFGEVKVTDCGSGKTGYSLTGTWSNPVNSGSAGSTTQRTVIDVTALPPDYILSGEYGTVGDAPFYVRIAGRLHFVYSVDQANNKLTVFPWVSSAAVPGSFEYVFGGGVYQRGADCNVNGFTAIDAMRCGAGIAASSLYGPRAERIVTQFCGVGILVGRNPSGASLGGSFDNIYFENNDEDIVFAMRLGDSAYNYFGAEYALNLAKIYCAGAPRMADNQFSQAYEPLQRQIISVKGELLQFEKASRSSTSSSLTLTPGRRDHRLIYKVTSLTLNLATLDADLNRLTGIDSMAVRLIGTGAQKQPTGTITINAPAGWTVNGGAGPITYTGLVQPLDLVLHWNIATLDVTVARAGVDWANISSKPATFAPSAHTHAISEVTALQTTLDGKAAASHTHTVAQITDAGALASLSTVNTAQITDGAVTAAKTAAAVQASLGKADTAVQPAAIADMVVSDPTGVTGADAITNIMSLTQAEYDAIGAPDAATFYVITG